jgi:hypothetical protein
VGRQGPFPGRTLAGTVPYGDGFLTGTLLP